MVCSQTVLYISRAGLPIDATGLRLQSVGELLEHNGYTVHYVCDRRVEGCEAENGYAPIECRSEVFDPREVHFEANQKLYSYLPAFSGGKLRAAFEILELLTAQRIFRRIKRYCEKERPKCIIVYNATYMLEKRLLSFCKQKHIPLYGDATEWYEYRPKARFAERYIVWSNDRRIRLLDSQLQGIIAISPYFRQYYEEMGLRTIFIPPLMEVLAENELILKKAGEPIRFVYAGSPGAKDILAPFLKAMAKVNRQGIHCTIDLIGIDPQYLKNCDCGNIGEEAGVFLHGRVPHMQAVAIIRQADFGILLRHDARYAKAGFSTKFAEAMSYGVGMICNRVGGTDLFVDHGQDGFLLSDTNEESIITLLKQLFRLSTEEINQIKRNALAKANRLFTVERYQKPLGDFLEKK